MIKFKINSCLIKIYQQKFIEIQTMFRSQGSQKGSSKLSIQRSCCCLEDYEDEICTLQQRLMQTHNKLITQLDVCQQQQLTIIQLTKKILVLESTQKNNNSVDQSISSSRNADISQQSNTFNDHYLENNQFTLNNSNQSLSNYNSPAFVEKSRNQLLKTDLQAMRVKLLQQITQKSHLKEELNQLKLIHNKKMDDYKRQIKQLQQDHQKLLKQYQYVKINAVKNKSTNIISEQTLEYEKLYKRQLVLNVQQTRKSAQMKILLTDYTQKIQHLQNELEKYNHCVKSTSTAADGLRQQRQQLCGAIRIARNPGTIWQKDTNKSCLSSNNQPFKRQKSYSQVNQISFAKSNQENFAKSNQENFAKKRNIQNQQNFIETLPVTNKIKEKSKRTQKTKLDYQSTKQLIKKLEQAQMITRQKKKPSF